MNSTKEKETRWRLIYIISIYLIEFGYGVNLSLIGTATVDLGNIYEATTLINTYFLMLTSCGYLLGSFVVWLYHWLNRQLVLIACLTITALSFACLPYYGSVVALFPMTVLSMVGPGAWDSSGPSWLLELWPEHGTALLLVHLFMMGLGMTLAPLFTGPFLLGECNTTHNHTITLDDRKLALLVPFSIASATLLVPLLGMLLLYTFKRYRKEDYRSSVHVEDSVEEDEDRGFEFQSFNSKPEVAYRKTKITLLAVCIGMYGAFDTSYAFYYPSMLQYLQYSMPPVHFSATESANLTAIMLGTVTVSRLITSLVSHRITPDRLLSWHYAVTFAAMALTFFGYTNKTILYAGTVLVGYGYSALWASILSFTEQHIRLTPRINSSFSFFLGTFTMVIPQALGRFLKQNPLVLFIAASFILLTSCMCFVTVTIIIYFTQRRKP